MTPLDTSAEETVATDTPPEATTPDTSADAHTDAPRPRGPRRWARAVPWVITVVAVAVAAISTYQWQVLASAEGRADSARTAAIAFMQDLTTWDATDGLDDEVERLRAQGTGPFLDELQFLFGGDELTSQLQADGVTARGEIQESYVQDLEGEQAEVFVVVSVTYDAEAIDSARAPVTVPATLVLEHGDGGWLVQEVSVPNTGQIGQLMSPAEGS